MLKFSYAKQEDIPEAHRELYTEKDGKWVLTGIEGIKTQEDIDRIQEGLRKEREDHDATKKALKEAKESLDTANDKIQVYEKKGAPEGKDEPTHEDLLKLAKLSRENEALAEENATLKGSLTELENKTTMDTLRGILRKDAAEFVRPDALDTAVSLLEKDFVLSDGKALTNPELGDKGGRTAKAVLADFVKDKPFMAIKSNSGGATGNSGKGGTPPDSKAVAPVDYLKSVFNNAD